MCIKAIANFDFEAAKDHVKETIKYLGGNSANGQLASWSSAAVPEPTSGLLLLLGVAGLALELDPKALVNKVKDKLSDEDVKLAVQKKLRLVSDIVGWVPTYIEGLVGAVQGYKA